MVPPADRIHKDPAVKDPGNIPLMLPTITCASCSSTLRGCTSEKHQSLADRETQRGRHLLIRGDPRERGQVKPLCERWSVSASLC